MLSMGSGPQTAAQNYLINCVVEYYASNYGEYYIFNPIKTHISQYVIKNHTNNNTIKNK